MASIPGLSKYPDLERKFQNKMSTLRRSGRNKCGACKTSQLIRQFRKLLAEREMRDK